MSYKTILTLIRSSSDAGHQISAAAQLARHFDAHLDIVCIGIDEVQMGYYFAGADSVLQETSIELAREKAESLLAEVQGLAEGEDIRWSARGVVSQYGVLSEVVSQIARYVDLVVLPQPYGEHGNVENEAILEAVLFAGDAPVLVVPATGLGASFPNRAVLGWDEGNEALRAARAALPLLRETDLTHVTMVANPHRQRDNAGEGISTMLDRQGVKAQIDQLDRSQGRISQIILNHATASEADLLVTGAYGHSRFREAILGGATREILENAQLPLLMAH